MQPSSLNLFTPANQLEWRAWLQQNHENQKAIWLVLYKKKSENHNLTWSEAVDEALCFGWIDSTKVTIDQDCYRQYFTQRKPKSNWSKINKEKVERLKAEGLMQEAGLKSIAIAKENGSWSKLDAIEALQVPEDLANALKENAKAYTYFTQLSNSNKKILLYWVISAKRPNTRSQRILEIVQSAAIEEKPKPLRR